VLERQVFRSQIWKGSEYRAALERVGRATGRPPMVPELLVPVEQLTVRLAPAGTPTSAAGFGALDLVSGGALSTALLHALLRVDGLQLNVRIWEPQDTEGSNLNRYVLLRRSMLPMPKIEMLRRWQHAGVRITGSRALVDQDLATRIEWAPWVFVGADRAESRWLVQGRWPEHLVVAGTEGPLAMVSEHDRGRPCAGCLHPEANPPGAEIATISFVSYLAGLLAASRLLRWSAAGPSAPDEQMIEAYADRLDTRTGFRAGGITRDPNCPVGHAA
jgi:hypothetical protein